MHGVLAFLFILLIGCAGVGACWFGVLGLVRYQRKLVRARRAVGEVIELLEAPDADEPTFYCPRVRFTPTSGQPVEFASRTWSTRPKYRLGDSVPVFYEGKNPANADIVGGGRGFYVLLVALGLPFLAIALLLLGLSLTGASLP